MRQAGNVTISLFVTQMIIIAILLILMIASGFFYRGMVSVIKRLNPEKQGDVLHVLFHREWERSCDEAQKKIIYESGYRAHVVMLMTGLIMELIALVSMTTFKTGLFPCLLIGVVLIAGQFWFTFMQYKMEEKMRSANKGGEEA